MYIGAIPTPAATESRQEFTATANQTVFSTTGGTVGFCDCYLNGVKLANSDFSFDGADVTLTSGAAAGDVLAVVMRQADNALVALPLKDSAGNNVIHETGGVVQFPAGHVIQVVYNQKTDREALSTSTGYTSIPGTDQDGAGSIFAAHITPTATSSKILVQVNWGGAGSAYIFNTKLYRDSTEIGSGDTIGNRTGAWMQTGNKGGYTNLEFKNNSNSYLDSPNSTSKLVYSIKVWDSRDSGTVYINRMQYDNNAAEMVTSTSSIVLMEIAG